MNSFEFCKCDVKKKMVVFPRSNSSLLNFYTPHTSDQKCIYGKLILWMMKTFYKELLFFVKLIIKIFSFRHLSQVREKFQRSAMIRRYPESASFALPDSPGYFEYSSKHPNFKSLDFIHNIGVQIPSLTPISKYATYITFCKLSTNFLVQ